MSSPTPLPTIALPQMESLAQSQSTASCDGMAQQFGALCWRMHLNGPEVLLITSRDTGRWILPKGWPMKGRSPAEAAAQEAWEEAGVAGQADSASIGRFGYDKTRGPEAALPCAVEVFSLRVERLEKDYPERKQRRRKWFSPKKAAKKVAEPELRALILEFAAAIEDASGKAPVRQRMQQTETTEQSPVLAVEPQALPLDQALAPKPGTEPQPPQMPKFDPQGLTTARE